jgi:hypothetical protein
MGFVSNGLHRCRNKHLLTANLCNECKSGIVWLSGRVDTIFGVVTMATVEKLQHEALPEMVDRWQINNSSTIVWMVDMRHPDQVLRMVVQRGRLLLPVTYPGVRLGIGIYNSGGSRMGYLISVNGVNARPSTSASMHVLGSRQSMVSNVLLPFAPDSIIGISECEAAGLIPACRRGPSDEPASVELTLARRDALAGSLVNFADGRGVVPWSFVPSSPIWFST